MKLNLNKKIVMIVVAVCLVAAVSLTSCINYNCFKNIQFPQKVSVKTNAQFNAPLGSAKFNLAEKLNLNELETKMKTSFGSSANIYNYDKTDQNYLNYILQYPMYNVPLDLREFLGEFNLSEKLSESDSMQIKFSQEFAIPEIKLDQTVEYKIPDVSAIMLAEMEAILLTSKISFSNVLEPAEDGPVDSDTYTSWIDQGTTEINIESDYAERIYYTTGTGIVIDVARSDSNPIGPDYKVMLQAKMYDAADLVNPISQTENIVTDGGKLILPLDSETGTSSNVNVKLKVTVSGGTKGVLHKYDVNLGLTENCGVKKLVDVTASAADFGIEFPKIDETIPLDSLVGLIKQCTIGSGSISAKALMPSGWSGVNCVADISVGGAGMETTSLTDGAPDGESYIVNKVIDLAGKTIAPTSSINSLKVTGTFTLNMAHAVIILQQDDGSKAYDDYLRIAVSGGVTNIAEAYVDFNSDKYDIPMEKSLPQEGAEAIILPVEMFQYVKKIDFAGITEDGVHYKQREEGVAFTDGHGNKIPLEGFGITCDIVNSFPAGNDIAAKIDSEIFSFHKDIAISGSGNEDIQPVKWVDYPVIDFTTVPSEAKPVDFSFKIKPSESDGTQRFVNIEPGKTYKMGIDNIKLKVDYDHVDANLKEKNLTGEFDLSAVDISSIYSALPIAADEIKKLSIAELPIFFFAQKPGSEALNNLLGSIKFRGVMKATYKTGPEDNPVEEDYYILGSKNEVDPSKDDSGILALTDPFTWPKSGETISDQDELAKKYLTPNFENDDPDKPKCLDLATIISKQPEDLYMRYDLGITGATNENVSIYSALIDEAVSDESTSEERSIQLDMAIIIPLKVKINGQISLNIMDYVKEGWSTSSDDLLGRESATSWGDFASYADLIDYMGFDYNIQYLPFDSSAFSFSIEDLSGTGYTTANSNPDGITFREGNNSLKVNGSDIQQILTGYPFHPNICINIGKPDTTSEFSIKKTAFDVDKVMKATINFTAKANGEVPITIWDSTKNKDSSSEGSE